MDIFGIEDLNWDPFHQDDLFGSFLPSSGDDVFSVGKLLPGDSWGPKGGPDSSENVLEDVLAQDPLADPLGQDWMESSNMDLFSGLGVEDQELELSAPAQQAELVQPVEIEEIVTADTDTDKADSTKIDSGSHILHNLLTLPIQQLTSVSKLNVTNIADMDMLDMLVDNKEDTLLESQFIEQSPTSVVPEIQLDVSTDSVYGDNKSDEIADMSSEELLANCAAQIMSSPLTVDEVESILSGSEPASPESQSAGELDNSDDEDYIPHSSSSTKSKKSSRKARTTPYSIPSEGLSKKERKKMQNKNAAIRYREKKRSEMSVVKGEEHLLAQKNKELKEKVDQISREIQYMKDLMAEVCKAKGIKITFKKSQN